jgi:protein O-GlcNAc transferase
VSVLDCLIRDLFFCCFNNNYKIGPNEFDIWMRLLQQVKGSVLWLFKSNKWAQENLQKEAQKRGILPERIIFADRMPHAEHLARHRLADLFLDTFNYNAHTTASDALWSGLPVVTMLGEGFAARVAGSLLTAIDLPELITLSENEYEQLALDLALNPEQLAVLKAKLDANRLTTPLFNTGLFARHIEEACQQVYQKYFDGEPPDSIVISP